MTGGVIFLVRNLLDTLEGFQFLGRFGIHECAHLFYILSGFKSV